MPQAQYDVGLGDLGDGIEKIFVHLQDKAIAEHRRQGIRDFTNDMSGKDPIVDQYLNAALKFSDTDEKVSYDMIKQALNRAGTAYDKNMDFLKDKPELYTQMMDEGGHISVDRMVKWKEKQESKKRKIVDFVTSMNVRDALKNPEVNYLQLAQEESEFEESGKPTVEAMKNLLSQQASTGRTLILAGQKAEQDWWKSKLSSIQTQEKVHQNANNDLISKKSILISNLAKTQKDLMGKTNIDVGTNEAINTLKSSIDNINAEIKSNYAQIFSRLDEEREIFEKKGILTKSDEDRKTLIDVINDYAAKKNIDRDQAAHEINKILKNPNNKLYKILNNKYKSLIQYDIPVVEE